MNNEQTTIINNIKNLNSQDLDDYIVNLKNTELFFRLFFARTNILRNINFSSDDKILEISFNSEIVSSYISNISNNLTIIESDMFSKQLREAVCKKKLNFISNLSDLKPSSKFDKIVIIGNVLKDKSSYKNWLNLFCNIKELLSNKGEIYFAIANKYSIKAFSGAKTDLYIKYFNSIEHDALLSNQEIRSIANHINLKAHFYYPLPDFYFAEEIFSENYVPKLNNFNNISHSYDEERYVIFDDTLALKEALRSNKFETFAPSFLVRMR